MDICFNFWYYYIYNAILAKVLIIKKIVLNFHMKSLFILLFLLCSCSPIFLDAEKITPMWKGKHHSELLDKIGPYHRIMEDMYEEGGQILIWEASKESVLLPIEKLGAKIDKKGTSISSIHVFIDKNGYILNIKKSVW